MTHYLTDKDGYFLVSPSLQLVGPHLRLSRIYGHGASFLQVISRAFFQRVSKPFILLINQLNSSINLRLLLDHDERCCMDFILVTEYAELTSLKISLFSLHYYWSEMQFSRTWLGTAFSFPSYSKTNSSADKLIHVIFNSMAIIEHYTTSDIQNWESVNELPSQLLTFYYIPVHMLEFGNFRIQLGLMLCLIIDIMR